MAAALFTKGAGLCCIHREVCRAVWRPQTAMFSSKPLDRKQPRRTHIKKAKPQPPVDVNKLVEKLFSLRRPGTTPPALGKAGLSKASPRPPITSLAKGSSSNVVPPAVAAFPVASSFKQAESIKERAAFNTAQAFPQPQASSPVNPKISESQSQTPLTVTQVYAANSISNMAVTSASTPASLGAEAAAAHGQTSAKAKETKTETATETPSFPASTGEALTKTAMESPAESRLPLVESLETRASVAEGLVEPTVDVPADKVPTKGTDSGVVVTCHTAKEETLTETTTESPIEPSLPLEEAVETRSSVVEGPAEPTVDATVDLEAQEVQAKSTDLNLVDVSHTAIEKPLVETIETPAETCIFPVDTLETSAALAEDSAVPIIDVAAEPAAQEMQTNSTDSGVVTQDISHSAKDKVFLKTTVETPVESSFPLEAPLESQPSVFEGPLEPTVDATVEAQEVEAKITDTIVNASKALAVESSPETTIESPVEASPSYVETQEARAAAEGAVETTVEDPAAEAGDTNGTDISHSAKGESLIVTAAEPEALQSRAAVSDVTIEPLVKCEAADDLLHRDFIQNAHKSTPLPLANEIESPSGIVAIEEEVKESEKMTLESVTLHLVKASVESLKTDELLKTTSALDEKAALVQEAKFKAASESETESEDENENLTKVLSKWESLSDDLKGLEGESVTLVNQLLCTVPAVLSKTPATLSTNSTSDAPKAANGDAKVSKEDAALTLESITLAEVKAEVGGLQTEVLQEMRKSLEKKAEELAKEEKLQVETMSEDVDIFQDTTEAEMLTLDSISEATDAIEAETAVMMEAMFGSEQGPKQLTSTSLQEPGPQDEMTGEETERESKQEGASVLQAMSLESVTLAEVEASLGTLESESLTDTSDYLEKEAEVVAGETRTEVEEGAVTEEMTEGLKVDPLSLPEAETLSEDLQTDELMEELLFTVPGHTAGVSGDHTGQAGTAGEEEDTGAHTDLDPIQRLFLEKIREYNNKRRLNGGLFEAEPDFQKHLSEETAKLQKLYGGGDLRSFPQFTFTEPKMDQDSK